MSRSVGENALPGGGSVKVHPLTVRITHWLNVGAVFIMVTSGWRVYNASPLFHFRFPSDITLGGWLAGALQWHFAAMWLLVINGLIYVGYGVSSGHYRRTLFPLSINSLLRAFADAVHGRLSHAVGEYNPVQRAAYLGVIVLLALVVLSGLVLWKPTQFQALGTLMGDYPGARLVHFFCMAGIVLFAIIHVVMVVLVPRTFVPMWTGRVGKSP
ncbi:MAG: cytochrome b/b6 domain-containing protein [Gammaproteobacteria bacterium]|jgi:thiosulfate reductase cytochrome b subunit